MDTLDIVLPMLLVRLAKLKTAFIFTKESLNNFSMIEKIKMLESYLKIGL